MPRPSPSPRSRAPTPPGLPGPALTRRPTRDAERIAAAAGFRDEVAAGDALSQDIAIPANEWGGPREDALDEEPTVENPVEDDLPAADPQEDEPEVVAEDVAPVEEPSVEEPVAEEPAVEEPREEPRSRSRPPSRPDDASRASSNCATVGSGSVRPPRSRTAPSP